MHKSLQLPKLYQFGVWKGHNTFTADTTLCKRQTHLLSSFARLFFVMPGNLPSQIVLCLLKWSLQQIWRWKSFWICTFSVYNTSWCVNARQQATKQPISGTRIHFVAGLSLHYLPTTLVSLLPGSPHIRYTHILCWWTLALRQQGAHNKWIQIRQEGSLQLQLGLDFPHSEPQTLREACKKKLWKSSQAVGRDQRVPDPNPKYLSIPDPYPTNFQKHRIFRV